MVERMDEIDVVNRSQAVPGGARGESITYLRDKWKSAIYSLIIAAILIAMAVFIDEPLMAVGLGFGLILGIVNYFVLAAIIDRGIQVQSQGSNVAAIFTMVIYHVRFWLVALIMYYAFDYWGARLGLSMLLGMSLLKWTALIEVLENMVNGDSTQNTDKNKKIF